MAVQSRACDLRVLFNCVEMPLCRAVKWKPETDNLMKHAGSVRKPRTHILLFRKFVLHEIMSMCKRKYRLFGRLTYQSA